MELSPVTENAQRSAAQNGGDETAASKGFGEAFIDLLYRLTGLNSPQAAQGAVNPLESIPLARVEAKPEPKPTPEKASSDEAKRASTEGARSEAREDETRGDEQEVAAASGRSETAAVAAQRNDQAAPAANPADQTAGEQSSGQSAQEAAVKTSTVQQQHQQQADSQQARAVAQQAGALPADPQSAHQSTSNSKASAHVAAAEAGSSRAKVERASAAATPLGTASMDAKAGAMTAVAQPMLPQAVVKPAAVAAAPAADYAQLQFMLANGGQGSLDASALRQAATGGGESGAKAVLNAMGMGSESSASTHSGDRAKAAQRMAPSMQAKLIQRISQIVESVVKNRDNNTLVVRLDPPELGQLTVKLTQRGDELYARITPENQEVEHMLKQRASEISGVLAQTGLKMDNVHVTIGSERSEADSFGFRDLLARNQQQGDSGHGGQEWGGRERGRPVSGGRASAAPMFSAQRQDDPAWIA